MTTFAGTGNGDRNPISTFSTHIQTPTDEKDGKPISHEGGGSTPPDSFPSSPSEHDAQLPTATEGLQPSEDHLQTFDDKEAGSEEASLPPSPARPSISAFREILFVAVICSSNIFTQASVGLTIAPLKIIGEGLGVSNPGGLSWFVAAYSLTVGTFILIAGRLGDMYGHKMLFVAGFFWYGFWALIGGFSNYAHSAIFFDVCRALQGIGPAMMVPNSLAILGRTYPPGKRKDMVFAIYGATAPNGAILGAVFASLLAQFVWWPWIFWVLAIACWVFGALSIFAIPSMPLEDNKDKKFDYLGAVTGVAGLVLFNVAWNQAPIVGWGNAYVIVFLILGLLFLVLFVIIERRTEQALVPSGAFSGKVGFVLGCIALSWGSFGIWIYYVFQFIENLRLVTPIGAAAQLVPCGISGCMAALTTGFLLSRVRTSYLMTFAMMNFCIGNILLATMPVSQTYWIQTFLSFIITVWGMDISFPASTIILSNFVPKEHQGIAASLVVTVVNYSISIGLGIAGTVESHVNRGGQDLLRGYRGAFYAAIGLSGMGVVFAALFVLHEAREKKDEQKDAET